MIIMDVARVSVKSFVVVIMGALLIACVNAISVSMSYAKLRGNYTLVMSLSKDIKVHPCPTSLVAIHAWTRDGYGKRAGVNLNRN